MRQNRKPMVLEPAVAGRNPVLERLLRSDLRAIRH
jgi:hypothetical protein